MITQCFVGNLKVLSAPKQGVILLELTWQISQIIPTKSIINNVLFVLPIRMFN